MGVCVRSYKNLPSCIYRETCDDSVVPGAVVPIAVNSHEDGSDIEILKNAETVRAEEEQEEKRRNRPRKTQMVSCDKMSAFGDDEITIVLEDNVQITLPKNITYWARDNVEEFLKLQDEARNSTIFIVAEKNFAGDSRVHFKLVSDSLLFA
ncbi:hypothetical protein QAD02_006708 [Eretmocerus hayati]|uniref:Uncharacterized protein n=1 Tax=Eretmocerus hayati TaxID=131215 RepID=A0ACC2N1Z0_9HYME|nr:hypothetical protein QAD02_006708 [Eretmocerus hayati]